MANPSDEGQKGMKNLVDQILGGTEKDCIRPSGIFKIPTPTAGGVLNPHGETARYRDHDDFCRDLSTREMIDCVVVAGNSQTGNVLVQHQPTGKYYEIPGYTAARYGIKSKLDTINEIHVNVEHIMYRGSPLCGFTTERPVDWPKGHTWKPFDSVQASDQIKPHHCRGCIQGWQKLPR